MKSNALLTRRIASLIVILLVIVPAILFSAFQNHKHTMVIPTDYDSYEKLWKEVDTLEQQGLTKSALEKVIVIYSLAVKSDNAPQIVKSLIYKTKYKQVLEEGGFEKALLEFEEEITKAGFPEKNILQSCGAELYWNYYQQNRWRFSQRTQTTNFRQDDIATWDLKAITGHVTELYKASLQPDDSLKQTAIEPFSDILEKGNMPVNHRPTLYDFLAHRALDFFMNEEAYVTQPAYKFNISGEDVFQPTEKFIALKIETKDTTSGKYLALKILQELIRLHLNDKMPGAIVDVELKRFDFLRSNSVDELKDSLYLTGLLHLENKYAGDSASASVSLAIAQYYRQRGNDFDPHTNKDHQWDKKTSVEYCDKVIQKFPGTNAAKNCRALKESILGKSFSLTTEQVNISGQPFRGLLQYHNVEKVFFRIIKNDEALQNQITPLDDEKKRIQLYVRQPAVQQWSQSFPVVSDYQQHAAEIKIPALPLGQYLILGASSETFSADTGSIFTASTTISNFSYISKRNLNSYSFYVLDRESGSPVKDVTARILSQEYDSKSRNYRFTEKGRYLTNEEGFFEMSTTSKNENFRVEFSKGDDKLRADDYFYLYQQEQAREEVTRTIFFTDRTIYRPGQTIYFKGIVLDNNRGENSLKTQFRTTVEFYDVNDQKLQSLNLVTNDYGSFTGSFTAPASGLNGEMTIRNTSGAVSISVEEYKRPKFEVLFDTLKGSYRLNDVVSIKGNAKSYAGANIDGAAVTYRVVRQARFPVWYWGLKRSSYDRFTQEMEISNGTTVTDQAGSFDISFTAIPDLKIPKKEQPLFNFVVYADVIDINGETHSAESFVTVGYASIQADIAIPENVTKDSISKFEITTENLNGTFEPAQGTIVIYSLKTPERIFRKRLWDRPDQFIMTKEDYYKLFPNDVFDNEDDFTTWEKKSKVSEQPFNTALSKVFSPSGLTGLPQGKYFLELILKDKYGEEVKVQKFFTLYSPREKNIPLMETLWNTELPKTAASGIVLPLQIGTAEKEMTIVYEIQSKNNYHERKVLQWKKGKETVPITITENFKGGVSIEAMGIRHGRVYRFSDIVSVPYSEKELKLEFETFRNKLLPGANEEWKLKVSGPKGEAIVAEMVAAMYDASLDAFRPNTWSFDILQYYYPLSALDPGNCFSTITSSLFAPEWSKSLEYFNPSYDKLNWFGFPFGTGYYYARGGAPEAMFKMAPQQETMADGKMRNNAEKAKKEVSDSDAVEEKVSPSPAAQEEVSVRKNLQETAFFFPQLQTDENGNVVIRFTIPEALTRWKFMGFAHTKDLKFGMITKETITQKDLMVVPNAPRFLREGDRIFFATKVTNLSDHDLSGSATLQLFDALTMKPADASFANSSNAKSFSAAKGQSTSVTWELNIPSGIEAVTYKVIAKAGNQSDGEESALPVLTNRMLVTETLPFNVRGNATKNYTFSKLLQSGSSSTLQNYHLSLEVTSNPAWYAVQALPYMMEYPYECSEQLFNRFYANALASNIANSNPKMKQVFDQWKNTNSEALLSNLEKNQELKSLLLQETPWVREAQDETERKKRIALLFDLNRMSYEMEAIIGKLQQLQTPNGGWSWFPGMRDDRYITQYIITGLGHLAHLNVSSVKEKTTSMTERAIPYLDDRMREDYEELIRYKAKMDENHLSYYAAQYLYARSYFTDIPVSQENKKAFEYFEGQARKYWVKEGIYSQGMIALALQRYGDKKTPEAIIKSLKENAITNEELGMYWKNNSGGYYWYQAPIETQSLLIEAFDEVANDQVSVDNMKLWLLKQKQTNDWKTTKATAEAVYALLLRGSTWLMSEPDVSVTLGSTLVDMSHQLKEAGTGYFKTSWNGADITSQMGNIKITRSSGDNGISWGAIYWQYFEQLDKITPSSTPLALTKKLFLQRNSETGPVIEPITTSTDLHPGDLVKVRIELRVDRDMEYVHMKDLRAASFEPLNVFSQYKWQDGLGYYEETKDASTNFFFDHLPKGTYVFEYPLRAQLKGDFSNGVTSVQCMYAPEFTSHSEGVRVKVD